MFLFTWEHNFGWVEPAAGIIWRDGATEHILAIKGRGG